MHASIFRHKWWLAIIVIIALTTYLYTYHGYLLKTYQYDLPDDELVIHHEMYAITPITKRLLSLAFPEYNLVYDNQRKPHLIIRTEGGNKENVSDFDAPWVRVCGEPKIGGVRRNGPPITELLTQRATKPGQFNFPFILQKSHRMDLNNIRKKTAGARRFFAAYINSNCQKPRETFFAKLKAANPGAIALGKCSNPEKKRLPGGWSGLENVYQDFVFGFAMENCQKSGYLTEKILNVFEGGAIPIFWGDSQLAKSIFNPKAYIDLDDFESFDQAIAYIQYLMKHPKKLLAMQTAPIFRDNIVPNFFAVYDDPAPTEVQACANYIRAAFFKAVTPKQNKANNG